MLYGIRGVFDARRGDTFGLQFEQAWTRLLERGGWWSPSYKTFEEFWNQLQEKGGWWDPIYDFKEWDRVFKTPSKKFEFHAQVLGAAGSSQPRQRRSGNSSLFPHWEKADGPVDEKTYPLQLHIYRTMALTGSRNANQPWLEAIAGKHLFERWDTWVEINPETAARLGISDGERVWVESPKGKIRVKARLFQGVMPEVVSIPSGNGHRSGGRWAKGWGDNPYRLIGDDVDRLTGYPVSGSVTVKIYKA